MDFVQNLRKPIFDLGGRARPPAVLCPGCGLARLPFDLVRLGYAAQGNEFLWLKKVRFPEKNTFPFRLDRERRLYTPLFFVNRVYYYITFHGSPCANNQ